MWLGCLECLVVLSWFSVSVGLIVLEGGQIDEGNSLHGSKLPSEYSSRHSIIEFHNYSSLSIGNRIGSFLYCSIVLACVVFALAWC